MTAFTMYTNFKLCCGGMIFVVYQCFELCHLILCTLVTEIPYQQDRQLQGSIH